MPSRIVFNVKAFAQIRTEQAVQDHIAKIAEEVAADAGDGYVAQHREDPKSRARSSVIAASPEAQADNARNNTLIVALGRHR